MVTLTVEIHALSDPRSPLYHIALFWKFTLVLVRSMCRRPLLWPTSWTSVRPQRTKSSHQGLLGDIADGGAAPRCAVNNPRHEFLRRAELAVQSAPIVGTTAYPPGIAQVPSERGEGSSLPALSNSVAEKSGISRLVSVLVQFPELLERAMQSDSHPYHVPA